MRKLVVVLVVIGFVPAVHAQRGTPGAPYFVRTNVEAEIVKGAPYSAEVVNESSQTLSDGNRILRRTTTRVFRDNEGRTRRETDRTVGHQSITISDPVAGSSWMLDADSRTARQVPLAPRLYTASVDQGLAVFRLNGMNEIVTFSPFGTTAPGGVRMFEADAQHTEERLSPRTIEGLRVEGVRKTQTIAAGAIGNERPIVVTTEEWTSPDLKVLVLSEHSDPRIGTTTYKLVGVSRAEPAAALFQVPSDYTTVTGGGGRGGRGGPAPR